ncbi:MAG: hypothetical protein IFK94_11785 [Acidobacteria bacterium]|uniref:Uncharacterized protein n=1 Tax=Candidatus Polarisedimenticola svalbardensis TaxID=2886004 RepID=A0A8J6XUI1_9BACT|nr:hypothetical protein [Candidatus Polarisedimenticola svalbardensis]
MPGPPTTTLRLDVDGSGSNSLTVRIPSGTSRSITFYTSGTSAVPINFTATSPFTDNSTSFSVDNTTGVTKTTSPTATGKHPFNAGGRTGDIDMTVMV